MLSPADFPAFFRAVNCGRSPFPWQERLAALVSAGAWPKSLDLPPAAGKTSCLDIAVFAMALRRTGPRRIFYVVNRRVVIDHAFDRMRDIAAALAAAEAGILRAVADGLRQMGASDDEPLSVYQLRGGIYRDDSWLRTPLQPVLIASTVDQVGSRLLFRGYGTSEGMWPVHAALTGNDVLFLLDEAHCSRAFADTLKRIEGYRETAEHDLKLPFTFVEMTAAPSRTDGEPFRLDEADLADERLRKRLFTRKPAVCMMNKARDYVELAAGLAAEAVALSRHNRLRRVAVIVNRVPTARRVYAILKATQTCHLLVGRMRPIDRESLHPGIDNMKSGRRRAETAPVFVVATQCVEVGADLDFDAIVTECASVDALLQRFGRLDRTGDLGIAEGRIVIASSMTDTTYSDPVYKGALAKTWQWLQSFGGKIDFATLSTTGATTVSERLRSLGGGGDELRRDTPPFPALLPAHLDSLAQTSPAPALEPDTHLFLHGKASGAPDIQVVWRSDLPLQSPSDWPEVVGLCPPVSLEALPVPLPDFRRWAARQTLSDAVASDLEGTDGIEEDRAGRPRNIHARIPILRWRGDESRMISDLSQIRPGDTVVLAVDKESDAWNDLGLVPDGGMTDVAERARLKLRHAWTLRLHPAVIGSWPDVGNRERLVAMARESDEPVDAGAVLAEYRNALPENSWLRQMLGGAGGGRKLRIEAYPAVEGLPVGWVLSAGYAEAEADWDEASASVAVPLDRHLLDVAEEARHITGKLMPHSGIRASVIRAAELHDCGKADIRFQALLRGGDPLAAHSAPRLLAKGSQSRGGRGDRKRMWERSGLPDAFRHELVSLALMQEDPSVCDDDLMLHLVASHHGRCRPFAPVVSDFIEVSWGTCTLTPETAAQRAAHRLSNRVSDRFWRLTRRYGWWGLAYLESLLRLADWEASRKEAENERDRAARA